MKPHSRREGACYWARSGFSIIEAVIVLLIVATVVGALTPSVVRQITHARINRAANVIAGDLFLAQGLAGRRRAPVIVTFDASAKTVTVTDSRNTSTVYTTRRYGPQSEFKIPQFTASPSALVILPNGMANTAVTVTLGDGAFQRQVRMSRAGQIRIL